MDHDNVQSELLYAAIQSRRRLTLETGRDEHAVQAIITDMLNVEPELFDRACKVDPLRFPTRDEIFRWLEDKLTEKTKRE